MSKHNPDSESGIISSYLSLVKDTAPNLYDIEKHKMNIFKEELLYNRYKKPTEPPISSFEIIDSAKEGDCIEAHYKENRDKIKKYLDDHGGQGKSVICENYDYHHDSNLLIHSWCKRANQEALVNWYSDIGDMGTYMGATFLCHHCGETVHSDYEDDTGFLGYTKRKGKNGIKIIKGTQGSESRGLYLSDGTTLSSSVQ